MTLRLVPDRPQWQDRANCLGLDPDLFFPEGRSFVNRGAYAEARRVCAFCEVREECLAYAKARHITTGMWGGQTPHERRRTA